jgi:hypothetical protein
MKRRYLSIAAILLVAAAGLGFALTGGGSASRAHTQAMPRVGTSMSVLRARFAVVSRSHSNQCALRPQSVDSVAVNGRLQGLCCTPMEFEHYAQQLRGLAAYRSVPQIPSDPYDITISQAKKLLAYDRAITLTSDQQAEYRQAMKLADEHGPCCCHCWRWSTFEGQAKYLLARRGYRAAQIAAVWDLEDG